jgi:hypothetical protein
MIFESIEVVMAAHLAEEGNNRLRTFTFDRESGSYAPPLFERILCSLANQANCVRLRFKSKVLTRLKAKEPSNLNRAGDRPLARDFGKKNGSWNGLLHRSHESHS